MSVLPLVITDAGRAALVNATHTGSAPIAIAQIGVTATAFVASDATAALPGEIKRLATFGGAAVAADTIHISLRDETADVYNLLGFALYLGDGTLFASYGQADMIVEKSAAALLLLAVDVQLSTPDAGVITFGSADFLNPPATTDTKGVVQLASAAEAIAGVDAGKAVTSAGLKAQADARLGAGSPTEFIKTLLASVSQAAAQALLGINWGNLPGKPGAFPPSAHNHAFGDVPGLQSALDAKATTATTADLQVQIDGKAPLATTNWQAFNPGSGAVAAPAWARRVRARCWGAGAGGGNSAGSGYGGGGAGGGGYAEGEFPIVAGTAYSWSVGAKGAAHVAGGSTAFASLIAATGGQPGTSSTGSSVGISGQNGYGSGGSIVNSAGGASAGSRIAGGQGAPGAMGGSGGGSGPTVPNPGGYPGGGGGGYGPDAAGSGSPGADGLLVLEWLP